MCAILTNQIKIRTTSALQNYFLLLLSLNAVPTPIFTIANFSLFYLTKIRLNLLASKLALLYPIAHIIRPQFASLPKIAVFTRFEPMIALLRVCACCKLCAFLMDTSSKCVAPSPSLAICLARLTHYFF